MFSYYQINSLHITYLWCHMSIMASQIISNFTNCSTTRSSKQYKQRISKLCITGLPCEDNQFVIEGFPSQRDSNGESISASRLHQDIGWFWHAIYKGSEGHFKNTYELFNLRGLINSMLYKNHIFQCMGKIFCVEFQRIPLKFHTKYLTHILKDIDFIHRWWFKCS